ncbi:hypothetical protein CE91St54_06760 [Hungatella hathewayi]|uniref:Uncharacterized protein n=1 Tax=Hungatella hathewayi TaxID=154046 RepID=A0AA37JHE3_9FIRM|nr:hypothetical protein CE91St55_07270 [Hungatella hathewayi]GKH05568.1 hypothetical protein CE91St54_06760 [Hungatella hathewayi]
MASLFASHCRTFHLASPFKKEFRFQNSLILKQKADMPAKLNPQYCGRQLLLCRVEL